MTTTTRDMISIPKRGSLDRITTPDRIHHPWTFDRVTVTGRRNESDRSGPILSLVRPVYSEWPSGPGLCELADAVGELIGPGWYGLHDCRARGFRVIPD